MVSKCARYRQLLQLPWVQVFHKHCKRSRNFGHASEKFSRPRKLFLLLFWWCAHFEKQLSQFEILDESCIIWTVWNLFCLEPNLIASNKKELQAKTGTAVVASLWTSPPCLLSVVLFSSAKCKWVLFYSSFEWFCFDLGWWQWILFLSLIKQHFVVCFAMWIDICYEHSTFWLATAFIPLLVKFVCCVWCVGQLPVCSAQWKAIS